MKENVIQFFSVVLLVAIVFSVWACVSTVGLEMHSHHHTDTTTETFATHFDHIHSLTYGVCYDVFIILLLLVSVWAIFLERYQLDRVLSVFYFFEGSPPLPYSFICGSIVTSRGPPCE